MRISTAFDINIHPFPKGIVEATVEKCDSCKPPQNIYVANPFVTSTKAAPPKSGRDTGLEEPAVANVTPAAIN